MGRFALSRQLLPLRSCKINPIAMSARYSFQSQFHNLTRSIITYETRNINYRGHYNSAINHAQLRGIINFASYHVRSSCLALSRAEEYGKNMHARMRNRRSSRNVRRVTLTLIELVNRSAIRSCSTRQRDAHRKPRAESVV